MFKTHLTFFLKFLCIKSLLRFKLILTLESLESNFFIYNHKYALLGYKFSNIQIVLRSKIKVKYISPNFTQLFWEIFSHSQSIPPLVSRESLGLPQPLVQHALDRRAATGAAIGCLLHLKWNFCNLFPLPPFEPFFFSPISYFLPI